MNLRQQPPTHSEITASALWAGVAGALGRDFTADVQRSIADTFGSTRAMLTDCGTSGLGLAIRVAATARDRPVALPAYACYDLVTAAVGADADIVFYDVDPHSLAPDLDSLHRALQHQPGALVIAHLYGVPLPVRQLRDVAHAADAVLIEDAAQAVGTSIQGKPAGTWGSLSVLSFGRGKGLTGGGGGALLANDEVGAALLEQARASVPGDRVAGWGALVRTFAQWLLARPSLYALPAALPFLRLGETIYHEPHGPGPMPRAAVGALQRVWRVSHEAAVGRRRTAERLNAAAMQSGSWQTLTPVVSSALPGYLRLPLLSSAPRQAALNAEAARLGVIAGYPIPLPDLPAARRRVRNSAEAWPGARFLADALVTLPTHRLLTERDVAALEAWLMVSGTTARSRAGREQRAMV